MIARIGSALLRLVQYLRDGRTEPAASVRKEFPVKHSTSRFAQVTFLLVIVLLAGLHAASQPLQREEHTPEDQYRFAEGLLVRKFYDYAEKEFRFFLAKHPDHELAPQATFRLIECLRNQDKASATLSAINQFQEKWSGHDLAPKLYLWKGELLLNQDQLPQALSCFKRLIISKDSVTREAALYFVGQCHARQSHPDQALTAYAKIAHKPFDGEHLYRPYALYALASAHQLRGEFDAAETPFRRLKEEENVPPALREEAIYRLAENSFMRSDFARAIELYELLLVEFPDGYFSREARKRRTWAYFSQREYATAIELGKDWRKRYRDVFDYEMDYIRAASLAGAGFFSEALPVFRELIEAPKVPQDYTLLARYQEVYSLLRLERYKAAADKAAAFARLFPKALETADVRYFGAEALYRLEEFDAGAAELRRAIDSFIGEWEYFTDAHLRLTECLAKSGKFKEAATVFRSLVGDARVEDQAYMLLRAGECERKAGDTKGAIADFELVLKEFAENPAVSRAAILHLGELYSEEEQYNRAIQLLQELMARDDTRDKARLLFFIGYLYFQQEKYKQAEEHLRPALEQEGAAKIAGNIKYFLAGTLLEVGQDDEALGIFAELLSLPVEQRPPFADSLLFRLDELYYRRNKYVTSETIARWLLSRDDRRVIHRASLRLSRILIAQNRLDEARKSLEEQLARVEAAGAENSDGFAKEEILSLLGEVLLLHGDYDRAVHAFEQSLVRPGLGSGYVARSRWGLGRILKEEKRLEQALHHAMNAFVLADDPTYTPRTMFLAVEILAELDRMNEALTTWRELRKRYPSFAEQQRDATVVERLRDYAPPENDQAPTQRDE